jgi:hypothetical protein
LPFQRQGLCAFAFSCLPDKVEGTLSSPHTISV